MGLLRRLEGAGGRPTPPPAGEPHGRTPEPPVAAPPPPAAPPPRAGAPIATAPPPPPRQTPPQGAGPVTGRDRAKEKDLKGRIQDRLLRELDPKADLTDQVKMRLQIKQLFDQIIDEEGVLMPRADRERLFELMVADIVGFGPIEVLLNDEAVSEIMVNGPKKVFIERKGKLILSDVQFDDDDHVKRVIERIIAPLGRRCDESSPYVDARLPDGSRVHAIIPPLALNGPTVTIRKFSKKPLAAEDLVRFGSMTAELAEFLRAAVIARFNIIVSGGTGS
ncbi:MAG: ATPase, T2SS/T4P/T4SS family, partial [Chloroflexi bacterium]|nr:ATPase, T2SS/T4P/T4SS family [Chloroflexota bacterium]